VDQLLVRADPDFRVSFSVELDYRMATFRKGKLIAYYGDRFEVPKTIAKACLRTEHQHMS